MVLQPGMCLLVDALHSTMVIIIKIKTIQGTAHNLLFIFYTKIVYVQISFVILYFYVDFLCLCFSILYFVTFNAIQMAERFWKVQMI